MITKEQAEVIGQGLVEQARRQELERKNVAARRVPFMYRFAELDSFEAWERPVVVAEATKHAMRDKSVLIVWAIATALITALAYAALVTPLKSIPVVWVWWVGGALFVSTELHRRAVARKYVRERAAYRLSGKTPLVPKDS